MAVESNISRVQYAGNGSTSVPYVIGFFFLQDDHIKVSVDGVLLNGGYTITGAGNEAGGNLTTNSPYSGDQVITIWRDVPLTQEYNYEPSGSIGEGTLEQNMDTCVMQIQQVNRTTMSSIRMPVEDGDTPELPLAADRLGRVLSFNATTGAIDLVELGILNDAQELQAAKDAATEAAAAAMISELNAATSELNAAASAAAAAASAISAKGFITIAAQDMTDVPTDYPVDQVSAMAVNTTAPGGSWSHAGTVYTYVFTDTGFNTSYLQIYVPDEDGSGLYTKVRHGVLSGSTWSAWGEWNDSLSRSEGGTVTGDTEFSGAATRSSAMESGNRNALASFGDVQNYVPQLRYKETSLDDIVANHGFIGINEPTIQTFNRYDKSIVLFNIDGSEGWSVYGWSDRTFNTGMDGIGRREMIYGFKATGDDYGIEEPQCTRRITFGELHNAYAELIATDNGIQVEISSNENTGVVLLKIRKADGATLWQTSDIDLGIDMREVGGGYGLREWGGEYEIQLTSTGAIQLWGFRFNGERVLLHSETTIRHPWYSGGAFDKHNLPRRWARFTIYNTNTIPQDNYTVYVHKLWYREIQHS